MRCWVRESIKWAHHTTAVHTIYYYSPALAPETVAPLLDAAYYIVLPPPHQTTGATGGVNVAVRIPADTSSPSSPTSAAIPLFEETATIEKILS